jgi:hypothetical protein
LLASTGYSLVTPLNLRQRIILLEGITWLSITELIRSVHDTQEFAVLHLFLQLHHAFALQLVVVLLVSIEFGSAHALNVLASVAFLKVLIDEMPALLEQPFLAAFDSPLSALIKLLLSVLATNIVVVVLVLQVLLDEFHLLMLGLLLLPNLLISLHADRSNLLFGALLLGDDG